MLSIQSKKYLEKKIKKSKSKYCISNKILYCNNKQIKIIKKCRYSNMFNVILLIVTK